MHRYFVVCCNEYDDVVINKCSYNRNDKVAAKDSFITKCNINRGHLLECHVVKIL